MVEEKSVANSQKVKIANITSYYALNSLRSVAVNLPSAVSDGRDALFEVGAQSVQGFSEGPHTCCCGHAKKTTLMPVTSMRWNWCRGWTIFWWINLSHWFNSPTQSHLAHKMTHSFTPFSHFLHMRLHSNAINIAPQHKAIFGISSTSRNCNTHKTTLISRCCHQSSKPVIG